MAADKIPCEMCGKHFWSPYKEGLTWEQLLFMPIEDKVATKICPECREGGSTPPPNTPGGNYVRAHA